jgi:ribose/xylose/arabinose/galactoside ABC-type transport system permease subunit
LLRAGPALILLILVVIVSLTTPVFFTTRNIGNVFSQTSVIAVLALGQLLVIISRGIDLSVGATVALSGVVGAIVYQHNHSAVLVVLAPAWRSGSATGSYTWSAGCRTRSSSRSQASASCVASPSGPRMERSSPACRAP